MSSSRRNGKPASCEPCRKTKMRCDHAHPTCIRCHQRGIIDQCFYHPAPLTKLRDDAGPRSGTSRSSHTQKKRRLAKAAGNSHESCWENHEDPMPPIPRDDGTPDIDLAGRPTFQEGYLGPTSYAAILPKDDDLSLQNSRQPSVDLDEDQESSIQQPLTKVMRHQMATTILKNLRRYRSIRYLVRTYWTGCQAGVVPELLNVAALDALKATVDKYNLTEHAPSAELVSKVLENSSKRLEIPPRIHAHEFHTLITGDNLRLEVIGYLLATAGRSMYFGLEPVKLGVDVDRSQKSHFIEEMLQASTMCLILCTLITPVNDVVLWLLVENLLLTAAMSGTSSALVWRRLGEVTNQIYSLGIHRESKNTNLPLFLAETRRRIYCAVYTLDKNTSTFLGRPALLNQRYTDIMPPGDLSDDEVCSSPETLALAIHNLDENGWNTRGHYSRASWIRIRFQSSQIREEILDLSFTKLDNDSEHKLMNISHQISESWEKFPAHFRYRESCWEEAIPTGTCYMILIVYLTHFYNDFMIHKLLSPQNPTPTLLLISLNLLTAVLSLSRTVRDRSYDVLRDCIYATLVFGVPSASVLASALQDQQRTRQPFPQGISRAEVIRTLSVLIAQLESATHIDFAGTRRAGGNYGLCRKAARCFAKIVDGVLERDGVVQFPQQSNQNLISSSGLENEIAAVHGAEGQIPGLGPESLAQEIGGEDFNLDVDLFGGCEGLDFGCPGLGLGIGMGMGGGLNEDRDWGFGQWAL